LGTLTQLRENIFNTDIKVIAHGVNCRGGFGSGIAGQIAKRYPEVRRAYIRKHTGEGWALGDIQIVKTDDGRLVVNMATQDTYGKSGVHVKYEAVKTALEKVLKFCEEQGHALAIPKIGCGLAGGDWTVVEGIITECLQSKKVDVEVYSLD
jgi:O-acetyl-ADP-ribose deacetylase (regulator of RNase III)